MSPTLNRMRVTCQPDADLWPGSPTLFNAIRFTSAGRGVYCTSISTRPRGLPRSPTLGFTLFPQQFLAPLFASKERPSIRLESSQYSWPQPFSTRSPLRPTPMAPTKSWQGRLISRIWVRKRVHSLMSPTKRTSLYEDVRVSVQSAIKDDLFEDEAHDEDEDSDFVPKGGPSNPTVTKNAGEKFVPKRAGTPILAVTSKTDKKPDAAAVTGNPKDASAQKKNVKTAK
ncbi:hypothetical protein LXA43DRAFT_274555 [Ganoderma leucocontextum]|nr:hypothetical protein LXA43DRAFT_274555 [Ganoderma leucocontextum]